jgi:hypothetical protein
MAAWIIEALRKLGGPRHYKDVAKEIWRAHEADIKADGDYFFVWNYELRWAGTYLCEQGKMVKEAGGKKGYWQLVGAVQ